MLITIVDAHFILAFQVLVYFTLLGRVPLDPSLTRCLEEGRNFVEAFPGSQTHTALASITQTLIQRCESRDT